MPNSLQRSASHSPGRRRVSFAEPRSSILRTRAPPSPSHATLTPLTSESRRDQARRKTSLSELDELRGYILDASNLRSESAKLAITVLSFETLCALIAFIKALKNLSSSTLRSEQQRLRDVFYSNTTRAHPHEMLAPPDPSHQIEQERHTREAHIKRKRRIAEFQLASFVARVFNMSVDSFRHESSKRKDQLVLDAFKKRVHKYSSRSSGGASIPNSPISSFTNPRSPRTEPKTRYVPPAHRDFVEEMNIPMEDLQLPTNSFDLSNFDTSGQSKLHQAHHHVAEVRPPNLPTMSAIPPSSFVHYPPNTNSSIVYVQTPPQPPLQAPLQAPPQLHPALPSPLQAPLQPSPMQPSPLHAPLQAPLQAQAPLQVQPALPFVHQAQGPIAYSSAHNTPTQTLRQSPYSFADSSAQSAAMQAPYVATPTNQTLISPHTGTPTTFYGPAAPSPVMNAQVAGTPTQTVMSGPYGGTPTQGPLQSPYDVNPR